MNATKRSSDEGGRAPLSQGMQRYLATFLEGLKYRGELMSLEWQEEKQRLYRLVAAAVVTATSASLAVLSINVLVLAIFWHTHRVLVVLGFCLFYTAVAVIVGLRVRRRLTDPRIPFQATFEELKRDRERFLSGKESGS